MGRHKIIDDDKLLDIARQVFLKNGHAATTRDVARAAGISQSVLYQRFQTKNDLFFAAMMPSPPDLKAIFGNLEECQAGVESYLYNVGLRILAYFATVMPAVLRLVAHPAFGAQIINHAHEHFLAEHLVKGLSDRIISLQQRHLVAQIDAYAAAETLIAAIHSIAMFQILSGKAVNKAEHQRVEGIVQVLWHGLNPHTSQDLNQGSLKNSKT